MTKNMQISPVAKVLGQIFFYLLIYGILFSDLGSGDEKQKSSENDQLTGHFKSFFNIFRTNSKTIVR